MQSTESAERDVGPYGRLALWVMDHARWVGAIAAVVTVVAAVVGLPPQVDARLLTLLPEDDPSVRANLAMQAEMGDVAFLQLAFEALDDEAQDDEALTAFTEEVAAAFDALDRVEHTFVGLPDELAMRLGLLQVAPDDIGELTARLKGAVALGPALNPIVVQRLLDMGKVVDRLEQASNAPQFVGRSGRGRLLVRPTGPASDNAFTKAFMADVEALLDRLDPEARGFRLVWMGGPYRHVLEDQQTIQQDLLWMSVGSTLLVLLVVMISFRSVRAVGLVFVPLVAANLWMLAFVALVIGSLNTFSSIALAVLVGLGIDFAIHLVGRYRELRTNGLEERAAIAAAWDRSGPPCTTAGLTSAAGFLALTIADFQGFSQLGLILAVGLLMCLVAMLVLLPLLLPYLDHGRGRLAGVPALSSEGGPPSSYRLAPLGLAVAVMVTAVAGFARIPELEMNFDLSSFRPVGQAFHELDPSQQAVVRDSFPPLVLTYDTRAELREAHARFDAVRVGADDPPFKATVSIESLIPSDQDARVAQLEQLVEVVSRPGMRYLYASAARPIVERLLPLRGLPVGPLTANDLPPAMYAFLGIGDGERSRMLLIPNRNMWDLRQASELLDEAREVSGRSDVAGEAAASATAYKLMRRDLPLVGALAVVLVVLLAIIDLRRPARILSAVLTLLAGISWGLVVVQALGVKLSPVNVVGLPILLGIGIDVIIHLLHRLAEEGPGGVRRALSTTGVAASLSTLTTVVSFLSLLLAGNRGVQSLGVLVTAGLTAVFVVSAGMLPLAWAAGWKLTGQAPADIEGSS